jgi:hypothetical protein
MWLAVSSAGKETGKPVSSGWLNFNGFSYGSSHSQRWERYAMWSQFGPRTRKNGPIWSDLVPNMPVRRATENNKTLMI